ncbi:unnamed protein product, partial [Trichogramma brassicae]
MAYGVSSSLKDSMELRLRIIPQALDQISLIAYLGQSSGTRRDSSDHFSVTYVRGYLMLTWDLGSGVRRIFTSSPLSLRPSKAHYLQIGRRGRESWLYVDGIGNVTGRAAGANTRLDVSPILYIGGHKSRYFEALPHDLPLHTGFSGCIYDVELRTDDTVFPVVTMSSPATGRGVGRVPSQRVPSSLVQERCGLFELRPDLQTRIVQKSKCFVFETIRRNPAMHSYVADEN